MIEIGRVKFVQIQSKSLKVGEKPNRRYDPAGIQRVDCLKVTADGVHGVAADGAEIIDIHHADHPHSKSRGDNGISIGFTSHHAAIAAKYGAHVTEGIAGENIIIESTRYFSVDDLGKQVAFRRDGSDELMMFDVVGDMAPCVEFSTFCARYPLDVPGMKETLQFLSGGRRGFNILPVDGSSPNIQAGDMFLLVGD